MRPQPQQRCFARNGFGQFEFHHFIDSLDTDRQGQRKRHPRLGVKPLAHAERQVGAAEEPFQAAHQIAMPDQPQVSLLRKTNAYS
jgi:hypothetical protein